MWLWEQTCGPSLLSCALDLLRMLCRLPANKTRMIIDRGTDWPTWIQSQLDTFRTIFHYRDADRLTTKAINTYRGETRDFAYLTPKRRLEPSDLYPDLEAEYLHCVCMPTRLMDILEELKELNWDPKIVYEPIPDYCLPSELENLKKVLGSVHVFSPNHEEAQAFFGAGEGNKESIEQLCEAFVGFGAKRVVIRSGSMGSCGLEKDGKLVWVQPYTVDQSKVVDPTGCGNAFLVCERKGILVQADRIAGRNYRWFISARGRPPRRNALRQCFSFVDARAIRYLLV